MPGPGEFCHHERTACEHGFFFGRRCKCMGSHPVNIVPCPETDAHAAWIAPGAEFQRAMHKHNVAKERLRRHELKAAEERRKLVDAVIAAAQEIREAR
jgi:hypothetical protein